MKIYQTILLALIMMTAYSVGYGKDSPPKTTPLFTVSTPVIHSDVIAVAPVNIVYFENENLQSSVKISAEAITSKQATLPVPKVTQLSKFIHYNLIADYSIKKVEPRARSSDILNQNKRC